MFSALFRNPRSFGYLLLGGIPPWSSSVEDGAILLQRQYYSVPKLMISPISSSFSNLKSFSFITIIMLTHHNWWSTHYECYAALCQNWGWSAGTTSILTNREVRDPLRKTTALSGGKTEKNLSQFFLRLANTYKKYILQKNWVKRALPGLGSGRNNLQTAIWGHSRQLDDQHRNPNINNKDHHVGQLTTYNTPSSYPIPPTY